MDPETLQNFMEGVRFYMWASLIYVTFAFQLLVARKYLSWSKYPDKIIERAQYAVNLAACGISVGGVACLLFNMPLLWSALLAVVWIAVIWRTIPFRDYWKYVLEHPQK